MKNLFKNDKNDYYTKQKWTLKAINLEAKRGMCIKTLKMGLHSGPSNSIFNNFTLQNQFS